MSDNLKKTLEETLAIDIKGKLDDYAIDNGLTLLPVCTIYDYVKRSELSVEQLGITIDYVNAPDYDCGKLYTIIEPFVDLE